MWEPEVWGRSITSTTESAASPNTAPHTPRCQLASLSPGRKRSGTRPMRSPTIPLTKTAARKFEATAQPKLVGWAADCADTGTQASHAATAAASVTSDVRSEEHTSELQ